MSSSQDQSAVGTGTGGTAAGTPASAGEASGQAPAGETTGTYVPRHVPRPAPGYDDSADYATASQSVPSGPSGAAMGFTALAAILMMLSGGANILEGIAAVVRGSFFVTLPHYAYNVSVSGWGWTHLIFGIVVFLAGACLFLDMLWARAAGVILASVSLLLNLVYIPYFPVWSIIVIALDAFVIWALLTPRRRYA
ncbi:MAG: hypothetical protein ABSA02_35180 [Trebonia sp.]